MSTSRFWEFIANYESFELVKQDYFSRHGRTPGTQHAREIAAPFSHARSFFRSAQNAELTVKPLLLYYGVVSLSRGLTLNLSRGLREASLTPSHGLSAKDWAVSLGGDKPNFASLRIAVTGGGSLPELARATGQRSLLRIGSSAINFTWAAPPIATATEFTLGDLLAREPALQDHHYRWAKDTSCARMSIETIPQSTEVIVKLLHQEKRILNRTIADGIFSGTPYTFVQEDPEGICYRGPNNSGFLPCMTDRTEASFLGIGDLWVAATMAGGARLSKLTALFSLAYGLGMLVRYFPTQWTALVRGQIDDAALPTLAAAVEHIETTFPSIVVDFLQDRAAYTAAVPAA